jgi:hypothetical protein
VLPYPTATKPPPVIDWIITLEGIGLTTPITYTYQDLTAMIGHGASFIPSAVPDWLEVPDDKSEWAGWEGIYLNRLLPEEVRFSKMVTITHVVFIADDGRSVELDAPWQGNAPIIALKNEKGEWLADNPGDLGPVRLIVLGKSIDLWIYRVTRIIIE